MSFRYKSHRNGCKGRKKKKKRRNVKMSSLRENKKSKSAPCAIIIKTKPIKGLQKKKKSRMARQGAGSREIRNGIGPTFPKGVSSGKWGDLIESITEKRPNDPVGLPRQCPGGIGRGAVLEAETCPSYKPAAVLPARERGLPSSHRRRFFF